MYNKTFCLIYCEYLPTYSVFGFGLIGRPSAFNRTFSNALSISNLPTSPPNNLTWPGSNNITLFMQRNGPVNNNLQPGNSFVCRHAIGAYSIATMVRWPSVSSSFSDLFLRNPNVYYIMIYFCKLMITFWFPVFLFPSFRSRFDLTSGCTNAAIGHRLVRLCEKKYYLINRILLKQRQLIIYLCL